MTIHYENKCERSNNISFSNKKSFSSGSYYFQIPFYRASPTFALNLLLMCLIRPLDKSHEQVLAVQGTRVNSTGAIPI